MTFHLILYTSSHLNLTLQPAQTFIHLVLFVWVFWMRKRDGDQQLVWNRLCLESKTCWIAPTSIVRRKRKRTIFWWKIRMGTRGGCGWRLKNMPLRVKVLSEFVHITFWIALRNSKCHEGKNWPWQPFCEGRIAATTHWTLNKDLLHKCVSSNGIVWFISATFTEMVTPQRSVAQGGSQQFQSVHCCSSSV